MIIESEKKGWSARGGSGVGKKSAAANCTHQIFSGVLAIGEKSAAANCTHRIFIGTLAVRVALAVGKKSDGALHHTM